MIRICLAVYRASLLALPGDFRRRTSPHLEYVVRQRLVDMKTHRTTAAIIGQAILEVGDVFRTAWSLRADRRMAVAGSGLGMLAATALVGFALVGSPSGVPAEAGWFDFNATDPAGEFTLTIRGNRAVAVTIDGIPLPADRIKQSADSIRILHAGGDTWFGVHFDPARGEIRWEPRPTTLPRVSEL